MLAVILWPPLRTPPPLTSQSRRGCAIDSPPSTPVPLVPAVQLSPAFDSQVRERAGYPGLDVRRGAAGLSALVIAILLAGPSAGCGGDDADSNSGSILDSSAQDATADASIADSEGHDTAANADSTTSTDSGSPTDSVAGDTQTATDAAGQSDVSSTQTDGLGGDGSADSGVTADSGGGVDAAGPATCTGAQWAGCDDGNPCTTDLCHHAWGCQSFAKSGCGSCTNWSARHDFSPQVDERLRTLLTTSSGVIIGVGTAGANEKSERAILIGREATGALKWTLNYGPKSGASLVASVRRGDGRMWLVGSKLNGAQLDGWLVRMKQDGKASFEWAVSKTNNDTKLLDAVLGANDGLIAVGWRKPAQSGFEALVLWRDFEGKPIGQQEQTMPGQGARFVAVTRDVKTSNVLAAIERDPGKNGNAAGIVAITGPKPMTETPFSATGWTLQPTDIATTDDGVVAVVGGAWNGAGTTGKGLLHIGKPGAGVVHLVDYGALPMFNAVTMTTAGDPVVAAHQQGGKGPSTASLARLDGKTGKVVWKRIYGQHPGTLGSIWRLASGGFVAAGSIGASGGGQTWMVRVGADGKLTCPP